MKNNNNKISKKKIIIIIIGALIIIVCLILLLSKLAFAKLNNNIIKPVNNIMEKTNKENELFNSIIEELLANNMFPNNLIYVDKYYGWENEWINKKDKYYFYIDENNYDKYKSYWLEDIDIEKCIDNYNINLIDTGDYIFHAINIKELGNFELNSSFENITITSTEIYYLINIYNEAIYYRYVNRLEQNKSKYTTIPVFKCNENSIDKRYLFHKENDKWIIEELTNKLNQ